MHKRKQGKLFYATTIFHFPTKLLITEKLHQIEKFFFSDEIKFQLKINI